MKKQIGVPLDTDINMSVSKALKIAFKAIQDADQDGHLNSYCKMGAANYKISLIPNPILTTLYIKVYLESKSHLSGLEDMYQRTINTKIEGKNVLETVTVFNIPVDPIDAVSTWVIKPDRMIDFKLSNKDADSFNGQMYLCQRLTNS